MTSQKDTLCNHSKISLEDIAKELSKVPMAIVGNPQHGKTTLAKHIVKELIELGKLENVKVRVWDSSTKWLFNSPLKKIYVIPQPNPVVYADLNPYQPTEMVEYQSGLQDSELEQILNEKCVGFDTSEIDDIEYERLIQQRLIHIDKKRQIKAVKENKGIIKTFIVWVCEESQGVFSSNSMRRKENLWLAKCISTSANFGISWLVISRRASEVSTQIFEHTNIKAIANSTQPNSIRKLRTILAFEDIERLRTFGIGEFLIQNKKGVFYLKTTKFKGNNPQIVEPQYIEQKSTTRRLFDKVKQGFQRLLNRKR